MKKFKKIIVMSLVCVLTLSLLCCGVSANSNEIPDDLPEGTIKISEGIYAYTSPVMPINNTGYVDIGTVPAYGYIVQPSALNNIIVDSGHKYLLINASDMIKINFVSWTQTIFGADLSGWPSVGGDLATTYYIQVDSFDFVRGVSYQAQCTSINDLPRRVNQIRIRSAISRD